MHNYYVIFLIKSTHNTCRKLMASHTLQSTSSPVQPKVRGFLQLLKGMAERPQDYISVNGRMTTNTVEGFHGLALMYRDKRTDLGHTHYVCKTNMAICHKVRKVTGTCTSILFLPSFPLIRILVPYGSCCAVSVWVLKYHPQPPATS